MEWRGTPAPPQLQAPTHHASSTSSADACEVRLVQPSTRARARTEWRAPPGRVLLTRRQLDCPTAPMQRLLSQSMLHRRGPPTHPTAALQERCALPSRPAHSQAALQEAGPPQPVPPRALDMQLHSPTCRLRMRAEMTATALAQCWRRLRAFSPRWPRKGLLRSAPRYNPPASWAAAPLCNGSSCAGSSSRLGQSPHHRRRWPECRTCCQHHPRREQPAWRCYSWHWPGPQPSSSTSRPP
mmetsp:Transcript_1310/g.5321  ORF Transcript_1310/g.5321 Transcript_1310/m.5321 type:complete len:240 (-) Transcript_1310:22-741(-)